MNNYYVLINQEDSNFIEKLDNKKHEIHVTDYFTKAMRFSTEQEAREAIKTDQIWYPDCDPIFWTILEIKEIE